jgi:hypothetical protein
MPQKYIWRAVLVVALSLAFSAPAKADNLDNAGRNIVIGIVAVTAAVAVVVTVVIMHESRKDRTITGCVKSRENGTTNITDEKDGQVYTLSGDTAGIKPGDRMKLKGKKAKPKGEQSRVWVATGVTHDFGVCQP